MATDERPAFITLLDYVKSIKGDQETYSYQDHLDANVPMLAGCQNCFASLASYNSYPSTPGYVRCADCIGDQGFATIEEFAAWMSTPRDGEEDADYDDTFDYDDTADYEGYPYSGHS